MNSRIKWKKGTLKCECRNKIAKQPKKWGINGNEKKIGTWIKTLEKFFTNRIQEMKEGT